MFLYVGPGWIGTCNTVIDVGRHAKRAVVVYVAVAGPRWIGKCGTVMQAGTKSVQ